MYQLGTPQRMVETILAAALTEGEDCRVHNRVALQIREGVVGRKTLARTQQKAWRRTRRRIREDHMATSESKSRIRARMRLVLLGRKNARSQVKEAKRASPKCHWGDKLCSKKIVESGWSFSLVAGSKALKKSTSMHEGGLQQEAHTKDRWRRAGEQGRRRGYEHSRWR